MRKLNVNLIVVDFVSLGEIAPLDIDVWLLRLWVSNWTRASTEKFITVDAGEDSLAVIVHAADHPGRSNEEIILSRADHVMDGEWRNKVGPRNVLDAYSISKVVEDEYRP